MKTSAESDSSSDHEGVENDMDRSDYVQNWNVDRVCLWLRRSLPFQEKEDYVEKFRQAGVHGPLLLKLTFDLMEDIGLTRKIHIHRILTDIEGLKKQQQFNVGITSSRKVVKKEGPTDFQLSLLKQTDHLLENQRSLQNAVQQLQQRFETMPYWNRVRMVEKLGLADTESISRHFEDMQDGAKYYPSIYVDCEKKDHIIIGHYTCFGRLYDKPFYVKNCKTKKLLLYYRSDLDKKRWRFTRTNKHSLADFCEKRKYQARTKDSCDYPAAHLIPPDTEWAVWDGRTDHNWWVTTEISGQQRYMTEWIKDTYYGTVLTKGLGPLIMSFLWDPLLSE